MLVSRAVLSPTPPPPVLARAPRPGARGRRHRHARRPVLEARRRRTPATPAPPLRPCCSAWAPPRGTSRSAARPERARARGRGGRGDGPAHRPRAARSSIPRTRSSAYQPCSVFKIVVAIAGLTEGVIKPETTVVCNEGLLDVAGPRADRPAPRARRLVQSVLRVGRRAARLREDPALRADLLGLGEPSGINLTGETPGCSPPRCAEAVVATCRATRRASPPPRSSSPCCCRRRSTAGSIFQPQLTGPEDFAPRGALAAARRARCSTAWPTGSWERSTRAARPGLRSRTSWSPARRAPARAWAGSRPTLRPTTRELVLVVFMRPGSGHGASAVAGRSSASSSRRAHRRRVVERRRALTRRALAALRPGGAAGPQWRRGRVGTPPLPFPPAVLAGAR